MATVGIGLHPREGINHWLTGRVITSNDRWRSNRSGDDYHKISLGRGIIGRPRGITEAAKNAGGDGQDAENGGLHCEIGWFVER